jgi:ATP-dependent DNA ligase
MTASSSTPGVWALGCPSRSHRSAAATGPDGSQDIALSVPPSRKTLFGSPLVLSQVHWVEPKLVAEITYLTWTADGLLRHTVYVGLRKDKPAMDVRRER